MCPNIRILREAMEALRDKGQRAGVDKFVKDQLNDLVCDGKIIDMLGVMVWGSGAGTYHRGGPSCTFDRSEGCAAGGASSVSYER